jgi:glyoxylase-like metal-dependent hydrolase (beta-lactamase superfamily II)
LLGREDLLAEREATLHRLVGGAFQIDRVLEDGDVVDLGADVRLRVVHTPGHTDGSVCFFWEAEGYLFSGDAVQGHGWRAGIAPRYTDLSYLASLDRIEALGASTLCMGHTFGWSGVINDPVRRGPEIGTTLETSRRSAAVVDRAAALAVELHGPDAPFKQVADAAFREIVYDLPITWDRNTTIPAGFASAIYAHLRQHGWEAPA